VFLAEAFAKERFGGSRWRGGRGGAMGFDWAIRKSFAFGKAKVEE